MKLPMIILSFATLCAAAHAAETGVRGSGSKSDDSRRLQPRHSARTPVVKNVGGFKAALRQGHLWPGGPFQNDPAFNMVMFDLVDDGDINLDRVKVENTRTAARSGMADRLNDDAFVHSSSAVELPPNTVYKTYAKNRVKGCHFSAPQPEVPGKVPILQGFEVDYRRENFDRNVQHLRARVIRKSGTNSPIIQVCHADFNDDDEFDFTVRYALVDEDLVFGFDTLRATKTGGGLDSRVTFDRPVNTVGVITGFNVEFLSGDRDVDHIRLELNQDGRAFVNFKDKTNNDSYRWQIDVAYIGAELLTV